MLVPVLLSLSAFHLTRAGDFSSYQWQPSYHQGVGGQLFHPHLVHGPRASSGVSPRHSYHGVVTDVPAAVHGPGHSPWDTAGVQERNYYPAPSYPGSGHGYHHTFQERDYRPPHHDHPPPSYHNPHSNHFVHHAPPPPHNFHHNNNDLLRSRNSFPSYNDFQRPPNREPLGPGGLRASNPLEVMYSWKQVDLEFPDDNVREQMIRNQQFIPRNNLILDVDVYGRGANQRVWVTLPRVRPGVPVSLATVSPYQKRDGTNLLRPFPNWRSHFPADCQNTITSVFRTHVDQCGKLWVLDSGNSNAFVRGESRIVCPPQILIYDLDNHDQLIGRYRLPASMVANTSLLVTITVDARASDCSDSVAYLADSMAFKLLAFRHRTQQFWSMDSDLFRPYPDQTMFSVNGVDFQLSGGIFGLALGPLMRNNRQLFFHSIVSVKQSVVDTVDIEDPRPWLADVDAKPRVFRELNGTRSSQTAAAAITDQGVMFFGLIGSNELACWNTRTNFGEQNIVVLAKDDTRLQFNSGVKVYDGKVYVLTNRLQNYVTSQVQEQEVNYRVLVADLRELTRGTPCDVRTPTSIDHPQHHPRPTC